MRFTESDEAEENPIALNDEFRAAYDTEEYEAKVSKLLHQAYARAKKEKPRAAETWDEAIRQLKKGDHYILVLWNVRQPKEIGSDQLKIWVGAIALVGTVLILVFLFPTSHHRGSWQPTGGTYRPVPDWLRGILLALFAGTYLWSVGISRFPPTSALDLNPLFDKVFKKKRKKKRQAN